MATLAEVRRLPSVTRPYSRASVLLRIHLWAPRFTGFGGGITAFSRELALALEARGDDLALYGKMDATVRHAGVRVSGSGASPEFLRSFVFAARTLSGVAWLRPDHIVTTHLNYGPLAHLARRAGGTPFTLVAHGIDVHQQLSPRILAAMRAAHGIVAVSDWTRARVLDLGGIEPSSVSILPNTFDESRFDVGPRSAGLARCYELREDERVILTVARLDPGERYKGYDRVIQALPEIRRACGPVRFLLVGAGEDRSRLETLAAATGVSEMVTLAGFIPDDELADHYRLADVFAMPSTGEGFGIVFLEAMGCGTPVVGGTLDGSVDALDHGMLGRLVDPLDVRAIAAGIIATLNREGPARWYDRVQLRQTVVERFGREAFRRRVPQALSFLQ